MIDLLECTLWQRQLGSLSEETVAALVCQVGAVGYGLHRVNMSNSSTWAVRVGQAAVYGGAGTAAMQEKAERLLQKQLEAAARTSCPFLLVKIKQQYTQLVQYFSITLV